MRTQPSSEEELLCLLERHRKNDPAARLMLVNWANQHLAEEAEKMLRHLHGLLSKGGYRLGGG